MQIDKAGLYKNLESELESLLSDLWLTNLANTSALLMQHLGNVNWVGFYLIKNQDLFLGPFQGKPACLYIPFGKGVCGRAAELQQSVVVADVHLFPGHIACDDNSRSEIVIPLIAQGRLIGVLDVDSPSLARFDEQDRIGLEKIVDVLIRKTVWPSVLI